MVLPRRVERGSSSSSFVKDVLLFIGAAASFATLLSIFGPTYHIVDEHHALSKDLRAPVPRKPASEHLQANPVEEEEGLGNEADVEDLFHEELFQATVKSCLPSENEKCKQFIPEPKGNNKKRVQRVALIAPPGDISNSLIRRVEDIVSHHNQLQNKDDLDIDLIETSHVPPYGYGKTHGLTKIIRLVPQPLVLEVTDALQRVLQPGETDAVIKLADVKAGLRQIIRFHCRLSHVSAHTSLMSVGFMDIMSGPGKVGRKLHIFLTPKEIPQSKQGTDDDQQFAADDDQESLFQEKEIIGTNILTHLQDVNQVDVNSVLDEVLLDELKKTKNLTAWPCQSFWTAGDEPDPTKLSPLTQRLARALSPDCDDPHSNCWVKRDKCEAKGDGPCKGKR